ncbi:hypothetical protein D3C85_1481100 [compost metagenome]
MADEPVFARSSIKISAPTVAMKPMMLSMRPRREKYMFEATNRRIQKMVNGALSPETKIR